MAWLKGITKKRHKTQVNVSLVVPNCHFISHSRKYLEVLHSIEKLQRNPKLGKLYRVCNSESTVIPFDFSHHSNDGQIMHALFQCSAILEEYEDVLIDFYKFKDDEDSDIATEFCVDHASENFRYSLYIMWHSLQIKTIIVRIF